MLKELSAADVKYEIDSLRAHLFLEEKEDTWEKIGKSITSLIKICENGGYDANPTELVTALRSSHRPIISAMSSERTRLCLIPLDLLSTVASVMGGEFEQLLPLFMQPLLTLCARTNKVIVNRARACVFSVVEYTQSATLLSYFLQNVKDKSNTLKLVVVEGTLACLNSCNPPDIEKEPRVLEIEAIIRASARDASADVRKIGRKMFESYQILFPSRISQFTTPLSPTTKKYLDVKPSAVASKSMPPPPLPKPTTTRPKVETKSSTSTQTAKSSSSRATTSTLSTGTLNNQTRSTAPMTRVARKDPTPASSSSMPYVPVRPVHPTKSTSDIQRSTTQNTTIATTGPIRMTSVQDQKRPVPPLRSQSIAATRVAGPSSTTVPANRLQLNLAKPATTASGSQPVHTGPRRVPMPVPVPAPAPPKEKEGPKRPASRVDNSSSTRQRPIAPAPAAPAAPVKKKPVVTAPSVKERGPIAAGHTRTRSTATVSGVPVASASSSTTTTAAASKSAVTKPVVVAKAKPQWGGRPAPAATKPAPAKPASATSQKAGPSGLARKPSSRVLPRAAAGPSKVRPITPAMVALPPSPTPEDAEAESTKESKAEEQVKVEQSSAVEQPSEEQAEVVNVEANVIVEPLHTPTLDEEKTVEQLELTTDDSATSTPISADGEYGLTPRSEGTNENEDNSSVHSNIPTHPPAPRTPQANLLPLPAAAQAGGLSSKTPISALLSSIEAGFAFSPITPLSPADLYLNPNNTTPYTHQPHLAPRQPFNHALHAPTADGIFSGFMFGDTRKKAEDMVRGDLGVIKVSEHNRLFGGMDDAASRKAFLELNQ
ncbi:hypothetical protein BDN70DRAFT_870719 [Pholiota conissans]|uniref:CLASP N-terminal domain-containing protein n=1 Tax=Pholiota conissans TaxID=109636 RepID=A0A9P6D6Q5_9AGAR|nr:hypothetical protein BDN70DRAFT_870719 [Pholiota conissans]